MKNIVDCEIEYIKSPHLNQIYAGFDMLSAQGLINLKYKKGSGDSLKPLVKVIINKKHSVVYDTLDGLNWVAGDLEENIAYFSNIKADYYFKRSYSEVLKSKNKNLNLFPLGFNYYMNHKLIFNDSIKNIIKNTSIYKALRSNKQNVNSDYFEKKGDTNRKDQIIFFSRLWDPDKEHDLNKKFELNELNKSRINVIKTCKNEFGDIFLGGLIDNDFTRRTVPEYISTPELTKKINYLNNVKKSNICIATTGLHNSTAWKFGEYLACSKAIISEPLKYSVTGDFNPEKNYLEFTNENQLIDNINLLLNDHSMVNKMMINNTNYYNDYLRPDKLILNTLLKLDEITF